jgi:hypothetical protein
MTIIEVAAGVMLGHFGSGIIAGIIDTWNKRRRKAASDQWYLQQMDRVMTGIEQEQRRMGKEGVN